MEEQCPEGSIDTPDERSPLITENNDCASGDANSRLSLSRKGDAPVGRRSKLSITLCILLTELCERLTFYGMTGNLLLFCSAFLELKSPWPSTISYVFQGTCYVVPLLGGWLADAYLGRFNVIYGSSLVYFIGIVMIAVVSIRPSAFASLFGDEGANLSQPIRVLYLVLGLFLVAFGTGGIKANVSPFGADQVEQDGPRAVQRFFEWFFWFINLGALLSYTGVVYIQQNFDFVFGYGIAVFSMFLSVVIFVTGKRKYVYKPSGGSHLSNTVKIIGQAIKNRKKVAAKNVGSWLDRAKIQHGGAHTVEEVEDVKVLLRIIPVFATFIVHFVVYFQLQTTFLLQATYMRLTFNAFTFPAASSGLFCIVAVLVLIPFLDHFVYPRLHGCFTPLRRIGVGMFLAAVAICVAGMVEIKRKKEMERGNFISQVVFNKTFNASSLNIFYQVPQVVIIGISDMLANVAGLGFAYSQAPKCLQGLVMGAFLFTIGLGNYVLSLIVLLVSTLKKEWYPSDNPNHGNLEYFFFLLGVIVLLNFAVFVAVASSYKYKTPSSGVPRAKKKPKGKKIQITKGHVWPGDLDSV